MKNWKTTIAGAIMAAVIAIQPIIETGAINWKNIVFAAAIAILGYLAKDAGVSGTAK